MLSQTEVSGDASTPREAGLSPQEKARVGKIVATLRQQKKFSQQAVATKLGVSRSHLCNIEAGRSRPTPVQLRQLAILFDISIDDILDGDHTVTINKGGDKSEMPCCPYALTPEEIFLVSMYRALSGKQREQVAGTVAHLIHTMQTAR
jgi:transcriptional regulator with XRE-family HTH domain